MEVQIPIRELADCNGEAVMSEGRLRRMSYLPTDTRRYVRHLISACGTDIASH